MAPTCTNSSANIARVSLSCGNDTMCSSGMKTFALTTLRNRTLYPIGLAKDGHLVWGPYKEDGNTWASCDVDVCNGNTIRGQYGYVSSLTFPYFVGCWGPGTYPN